jgi:putative PEP-CTERM system TPR-repeat lipoprotein
MLIPRKLSRTLTVGIIALVLAACGRNDPASLVASARGYMEKNDNKAAIIQLKNALQAAPDSAEARYLLGKALLENGEPGAAETEIRKAIDLKYPADETYPLLARALLQQGQYQKVVSALADRKLTTPLAQADALTSLGLARLGLDQKQEARAAIEAALMAKPGYLQAIVAQARLAAVEKDLPGALKLVDTALATSPDDIPALLLKADLQTAQGQPEDGIKTLEHVLKIRPDALAARYVLVSVLARTNQLDRATAELEPAKKSGPKDPRTLYAEALIAYNRNDMAVARTAVQSALNVAPDYVAGLYLSALIDFRLGSYGAAGETLRAVLAKAPDDVGVRKVLAATYMREGRVTQALETLEPALQRSPDNTVLLRAAAEMYLASNNPAKAAEFYERANALDKNNVGGRVRLAQAQLATGGDTARALKDLEAIAAANPSAQEADLALISAHLQRRETDKALAAAEAFAKKQPGNPLAFNVEGVIYSSKRDLKAARAAFDQALKIDPKYIAAAQNLARLDLMERDFDGARKRYEQILVQDPRNEQASLALAGILAATNAPPADVKAAIDRAIAADPNSIRAHQALIAYFTQQHDVKSALTAARAAESAFPGNPQLLEALGTAQQAAGENNQALETLTRAAKSQPQNALPLYRLAGVQATTKDYDGAIATLHKAIRVQPEQGAEAWTALASVFIAAGRVEDGIADSRKLQKEFPARAVGFAVEGEMLVRQKKFAEAATAFRDGLAREPIPLLSLRLYMALQAAGKQDQATAFALRWQKEHPKDVVLRNFQGQQSLVNKDYRTAAQHFKAVLDVEPDNTVALNNLAWLLNELGDPKALEYAEHASALAPFAPSVMDTHGWILVQHGDAARGLVLLRKANNIAPQDAEIQLHLAKALLKTGDKAAAKSELEKLAAQTKESAARTEAQQLLKKGL